MLVGSALGSSSSPPPGRASLAPTGSPRQNKTTFFPLYVQDVLEEWPEDNRARTVMSVDDAIEAVTRPELRQAIVEIKERGLHLVMPKV